MRSIPFRLLDACSRITEFAVLAALFGLICHPTATRAQATAADSGIVISGFVIDSARGGTLARAIVQLLPGRRETFTDSVGQYRFAGVAPGEYTLRVLHSRLDTLGLAIITPAITPDGSRRQMVVDIAVPPVARLLPRFCAPAQMLRGVAALVGFVRDPDTELPIENARVSLVFEANPHSLGLIKDLIVRQATTDASGRYRICGLPSDMNGKLQVERQGVATAEIPIVFVNAGLEVRGLSFSPSNAVVTVVTDSGRTDRLLTGPGRLFGRVQNKQGQPVEGARVTVVGANAVAITRATGAFSLDSLPVGSQVVQARKIGYGATEQPVELSAVAPQTVQVTMLDFIPTLETTRVVGITDRDLEKVGYLRRKKSQGGYHFDGERLNRGSETFTQSLVGFPSLRVVRGGTWANEIQVQDIRDPRGCVVFYVDGSQWKSLRPGDIDDFVRPYEVQAIEIYRAGTIPPEFSAVGKGRCMTIVVWTKNKVRGG